MIDYNGKSWVSVLSKVKGSVLPRLLPRTIAAGGVGYLAQWLYTHQKFHTPATVHTLIGVALGLLLVFRTNSSFDRWWEGRKLLGGIVNRTRDLARQSAGYFADDAETRTLIVRHLDAYLLLAAQSLRSENDLGKLGDLLTSDEKKKLEKETVARASRVLSWITRRLDERAKAGKLSEVRLLAMDTNLTALVDYYSGCERIARTPVPFAYAHHIKLFVMLFVFTVPFAISDVMKEFTPLAAAILAYALLGIDEIGVEIEDPFGYDHNDLPIDRIAKTISSSTHEITQV